MRSILVVALILLASPAIAQNAPADRDDRIKDAVASPTSRQTREAIIARSIALAMRPSKRPQPVDIGSYK